MSETAHVALGVFIALVARALVIGAIEAQRMRRKIPGLSWLHAWLEQSRMNG